MTPKEPSITLHPREKSFTCSRNPPSETEFRKTFLNNHMELDLIHLVLLFQTVELILSLKEYLDRFRREL